jgi:hypothetical protein
MKKTEIRREMKTKGPCSRRRKERREKIEER